MAGPPVFEGLPQPQTGTGDWVRANNGTLQKVSVTVGTVSIVTDPTITPSATVAVEEMVSNAGATRQMTTFVDSGQTVLRLRRARGTAAAPTVTTTGSGLALIDFRGHDGTSFQQAATIQGFVDGTPSSDMPGGIRFATTGAGGTSSIVRWHLRAVGNLEPLADVSYDIGTAALAARTVYANAHYYRPGTVAALPAAAAGNVNETRLVSDALTPVKGAAVVGGGAVYQLVVSTGAAWTIL